MRREYEYLFRAQNKALKEGDNEALEEVTQLGRSLGEYIVKEQGGTSNMKPRKLGKRVRSAVEGSQGLQRKKIRVMDGLHEDLRRIDQRKELSYPKDARKVRVLSENSVEVIQPDGSAAELMLADLVADLQWDIVHELPVDAPRRMQRRYALERRRKSLEDLRDQQMGGFNESAKGVTVSQKRILDGAKRGHTPGNSEQGFSAEIMAHSLLLRNSFDQKDTFRVIAADPVQDVVDKVDFIIDRRAKHTRGVDVEISGFEHVGIQFTLRKGSSLAKKRKKMQHALGEIETEFDDVVLVSVPGKWTVPVMEEWISAGRPSGGPEQFLDEQQREALYKTPLQKMFTEEEINAMWERVRGRGGGLEQLSKAA